MLYRNRSVHILLISIALLGIGVLLLTAASNHSASGGSGETLVQVQLLKESVSPAQPLQIIEFNYRRTSNSLNGISVAVKNISQIAQDGIAWYILAPAGTESPWQEAAYSAPEQALSLEPGMSAVLNFDPPTAIPDGSYDLSVWVHGVRDDERFHSDGAGAAIPIFIGQPFTLDVTDVNRIEQIDGSIALEITMEASNHSGVTVDAEMLFSIITASAAGRLSGLPEYIGNSYRIELDDGERAISTLRGAVILEPGTYNLIGWLRRRDTNVVIQRVVSTAVINIE